MIRNHICLGLLAALVVAAPAAATLSIASNANIVAGQAAFGVATPQLTWRNLFAPGTVWTPGAYPPAVGPAAQTDPATGSSVSGNLSIANYIDGTGFDIAAGVAGPDLAINGAENFTLHFAAPVSRIGFAVATGRGSFPGEFDHLGAVFGLTTDSGDTGTLTLVDTGSGYAGWVSVASATPFTSLSFAEPSGNLNDQYFGDIVSGAGVPEPAAWALLVGGFALTGMARRRVRAVAA